MCYDDIEREMNMPECPSCHGTKSIAAGDAKIPCATCLGTGETESDTGLKMKPVTIPCCAIMSDGQLIGFGQGKMMPEGVPPEVSINVKLELEGVKTAAIAVDPSKRPPGTPVRVSVYCVLVCLHEMQQPKLPLLAIYREVRREENLVIPGAAGVPDLRMLNQMRRKN